jgi:hypothetical protein
VRFHWLGESETIPDGKKSSTNLHILMNWQKHDGEWNLLSRASTKLWLGRGLNGPRSDWFSRRTMNGTATIVPGAGWFPRHWSLSSADDTAKAEEIRIRERRMVGDLWLPRKRYLLSGWPLYTLACAMLKNAASRGRSMGRMADG